MTRFDASSFDPGHRTVEDEGHTLCRTQMLPIRLLLSSAILTLPIATMPLLSPLAAHTVKVANNVAAMFHIEPNHNPKAGRPTRVWVVLTKPGGQIIPASACNCHMAIYPQPRRPSATPLLQPSVQTVNAEQYQGIVGADVTFPRSGRYDIELRGTAKKAGVFGAFKVTYGVTVSQ